MKKKNNFIAAIISVAMMFSTMPATANAYKVYPDIQSALESLGEGALIVDTYYNATDTDVASYLVLTKDCSLMKYNGSQPVVKVEFREGYGPEDITLTGDASIKYVDFEKLPENGREYLEALLGDKAGSGYYLSAANSSGIRAAIKETKKSATVREIYAVTPLEQHRPYHGITRIAVNTDITAEEFKALYPEFGLITSDMQFEGYNLVFDLSENIWPRMEEPGKAYDAMVRLVESGVEHRINPGVPVLESGESETVGLAEICTLGDANCDNKVTVADAVAVLQYIANAEKYPMTEQAKFNADIDGEDGITGGDATAIQRIDAGIR